MSKLFVWLKGIFESLFKNMAIVAAPLAAAMLTGLSVGKFVASEDGPAWGLMAGVTVGFALEACGYLSFVAYQQDRNKWRPALYIVGGVLIALILESPWVEDEWHRFATTLAVFSIVGMTYWNFTGMNARQYELEQKIEGLEMLADAGYEMKRGRIVKIKQVSMETPKGSSVETPKDSKKLSFETLSPEVKRSILDLNFREFRVQYGANIAESTFYNWRKKISKEENANGL